MKKALALLALSMALVGCGLSNEVRSLTSGSSGNLIWIWAHVNVPIEKNEIDSYYYFGRVPQNLFNKISENEINSGFILFRDVRYWGKDDLIHAFKDRQNTGDILFRIEDLRKVELVANEPVVGRGNEQYDDPKPASSSASSATSASAEK